MGSNPSPPKNFSDKALFNFCLEIILIHLDSCTCTGKWILYPDRINSKSKIRSSFKKLLIQSRGWSGLSNSWHRIFFPTYGTLLRNTTSEESMWAVKVTYWFMNMRSMLHKPATASSRTYACQVLKCLTSICWWPFSTKPGLEVRTLHIRSKCASAKHPLIRDLLEDYVIKKTDIETAHLGTGFDPRTYC